MATSLSEIIKRIGTEYLYAKAEPFNNHSLAKFVRQEAPASITEILQLRDTNLVVRGSVGQSGWSDVPWIALMDALVTASTLRGYYIVYLFSADGKRAYLAMGQGVTSVRNEFRRDWKKVIKQRASLIRTRLPAYRSYFDDSPLKLEGNSPLSKDYEEAPAFYKEYIINDLPTEETLRRDLERMLSFYSELILLGGTDFVEDVIDIEEKSSNLTILEEKRFRLHQRVEGRANTKKVKEYRGYVCEACGFDFFKTYGDIGKNFIEAHHLLPFSKLEPGKMRKIDIQNDFAVLCANCHRMIHKLDDPSQVSELKSILVGSKKDALKSI